MAELERAARALEMVEHGRSIQASARSGGREIEAQTAIKRGYLNILHAREAIAHQAKLVDRDDGARGGQTIPAAERLTLRAICPIRGCDTRYVVVSWGDTTSGSGATAAGARMRCPHCGDRETRVVDSRDLDDSATIRRRRECSACATRFTTYERVEAARLVIVKRDGARQEFDREKLASGLRKALTRRPVPDDAAEKAADEIEAELRSQGTTEVESPRVGALAMAKLRELDQIAYIRFASVYQSFDDLEALKREVDSLFAERGDDTVAIDVRPGLGKGGKAGKSGKAGR